MMALEHGLMSLETAGEKGKVSGSHDLADLLRRVQEDMSELDAALELLGSSREPKKRLDRAPLPAQTIPIFNPATLSY